MPVLKLSCTLLLTILLQSCQQKIEWHGSDITGMLPDLEFTLTGPENRSLDAKSLRGKSTLVFFGFTHCPDVCPTTLTQLSVAIRQLGAEKERLRVLLISVDPVRDTPTVMKTYTAAFGPWLLGLTGPESTLASMRKDYGVYAAMESSESSGTYNVMHTAAVFAFDSQGRARLLITDVNNTDALVSDLRNLINL